MKRKKNVLLGMALVAVMSLTSCLDDEGNTYRITATTFATVTDNGAGKYRLFLDENRGILEPTEESRINWGDARRVMLQYDIPFADTLYDNTHFKSIVRSATKVPIVSLVDIADLQNRPDTLGNEPVVNMDVTAYRGYLTFHSIIERDRTGNDKVYYSFDKSDFQNDTLHLNLCYLKADADKSTSDYVNHLECAEIPAFVRELVKGDSLYITLSCDMWKDLNKREKERVTRCVSVSKRRLIPPTYDKY